MTIAAVAQICSRQNVKDNALKCVSLIKRAADNGAKAIFLPEASDFIAQGDLYKTLSEPLSTSSFLNDIRAAAISSRIWVSLGLHEGGASDDRCFNTQVMIDDKGDILSSYRKVGILHLETHLFDVKDVGPGNKPVLESMSTEPGKHIEEPIQTPVGMLGMLTCYDIRFPEVSLMLRSRGAQVLTYPSSFTVKTGKAHWETLLRARAIETQCYVIAAAQAGVHTTAGRTSYGRSMVVNPWGEIVTQLSTYDNIPSPFEKEQDMPDTSSEIAYFDIDLDYLNNVRASMPLWQQRRQDVYD
ncbi:hypothetical protein E3Q24_02522 [Wallemia mellicola]|nr:hypothetical protein E3Q24_02522 [Wallemia mellicola]TIC19477.1 carbon-nitrogen hydrolase [Wallemia mellicola]